MMKKLILNCFHLHGLSNKFPFLFLSFAMFHDPGLLFWWEPMLGRNLSNYVTDVTYIVYHFQVKWTLVAGRNCSAFRYIRTDSYFSYTEQNNICNSSSLLPSISWNSRFTEFVSCVIYLCILCTTTAHIGPQSSLLCESIKLCLNSCLFATSKTKHV